jgi:fructosamine-3-kinase
MPKSLDPLLVKAFEAITVDPSALRPVSSGIYTDGSTSYFTKISSSLPQLRAENACLVALSATAPAGFIPRPFTLLEEDGRGAMISEYFNLGGTKNQRELGLKLAQMHQIPPKERWDELRYTSRFGFTMPTFCGVTQQDNGWSDSWKDFYVDRRLGDMVRRIGDSGIKKEWERMQEM